MSDFLNDVMAFPYFQVRNRVGNHVMCYMESEGKEMHFLATDDSDWYGILMVQYQGTLTMEQGKQVKLLLRSLNPLPLRAMLCFECHDVTQEVRAVLQWPLHDDYFGYDDVKNAIYTLFNLWMAVEPSIRRVRDGEDVEAVAEDVNKQLALLNPQLVKSGSA